MTISSMEFSSGFSFRSLVMPSALKDRVAIVTGSAGLLGRQHCMALAQAGAQVVATDLDSRACEKAIGEIAEGAPGEIQALAADITRPDDLNELRRFVIDRFGRVDVLVNNAALNDKVEDRASAEPIPFEQYPLWQWKSALDVN
jgi:NAD(P)-dependent dehydrogenase (short-subunit alcohol dehydrogenase family)